MTSLHVFHKHNSPSYFVVFNIPKNKIIVEMASALTNFHGRRNVAARVITVSTIQGSSISTASITTSALSLSSLTGSTINASSITFSSLAGSSITSNMLSLSTLTVSSINSGAPGVAAYSTFNASSINTSSITTSSITTAPGFNSNIGNVIYTSLADSGQTAANLITTGMPATAPSGTVISGSYRATSASGEGRISMRLAYTFVVGTIYNFTFTGMQGSTDLGLRILQYNPGGFSNTEIGQATELISTTAATISGSFTPSASGVFTGTIIFHFQALSFNPFVNFTAFSMTMGGMNVGIGMSNPIAKFQINQDGNSTANELGSHSLGILSNQGTSGTNRMYMMMDADFTNQCCSIQSIIYSLTVWNLNLNPRGGNVGIGTTNPSAVLHINDSLTTATSIPLMLFSPNLSTGGSQYLYFGRSNTANNSAQLGWTNVGAGSASNYAFLQIFGRANIMTWQASSGNVGIGTTNPEFLLHGYGNVDGGVQQYFQNINSGTNAFTLIGCRNNTPSQVVMFLNSSTRATEGGSSVATVRNDAGSLRLQSASGNAAGNIFIAATTGLVGIGTTDPSGILHVAGNTVVANYKPYVFSHFTVARSAAAASMAIVAGTENTTATLYLGTPLAPGGAASSAYKVCILANGNGSGIGWSTADLHFCLNSTTGGTSNDFANTASITDSKMVIKSAGNVGIGTNGPNALLHVNGTTIINGKTMIGSNTSSSGMLNINNIQGSGISYTHFNWTEGFNYIRGHTIFDTHWVSIGTASTFCPLYITSSRSNSWTLGHYLQYHGVPFHNAVGTWNVAIWAENVIVTTVWFGTVSDRRIKKNIEPVGPMLETINKIEIVSFDFIDEPNNKRDECGVIAQQLETVFPNAVDTSIGFVPCYLKFATSQHLVDDDLYIFFDYDSTDPQQNFKVGDKIKLHAVQTIDDKDKGSHHVVVKSIIDGGFITTPWKEYQANDGIFLHGKEVNDFRNVDKEQLGILALKGVQELSSMMSTLQAENAELKSQVTSLSASMAALLTRIEALEAR